VIDEDKIRSSVLWPFQVRTSKARSAWRLTVYAAGYALTHAGMPDGRRGALSVPTWVNRVLAAVAHAMHWAGGGMVVEEAARVLRDPDACPAVRAAWVLGGIEAAAGVVLSDSGARSMRAEMAQGERHGEGA
jgi:hypothetical protein